MNKKTILAVYLIYAILITTVQAKVVFGGDISTVTHVNTTVIDDDEAQISWLTQIYQVIEDLFFITSKTNNQEGYCQIIADNNETFESPEINRKVYITEYTHDEYLKPDNYFIKVRCRENDKWGYWTDVEVHTHDNEKNTIYVDWSY